MYSLHLNVVVVACFRPERRSGLYSEYRGQLHVRRRVSVDSLRFCLSRLQTVAILILIEEGALVGTYASSYLVVTEFTRRLAKTVKNDTEAQKGSKFRHCRQVSQFENCFYRRSRVFQPSGSYDMAQIVECLRSENAFFTFSVSYGQFREPSVTVGYHIGHYGWFSRKPRCRSKIQVPNGIRLTIL